MTHTCSILLMPQSCREAKFKLASNTGHIPAKLLAQALKCEQRSLPGFCTFLIIQGLFQGVHCAKLVNC